MQLKNTNLSISNPVQPKLRSYQLSRQENPPPPPPPPRKLEIKHENDQYKIEFEAQAPQVKKMLLHIPGGSICILIWAMLSWPRA